MAIHVYIHDAVNYGVNVRKEGKYFVASGTIATTARGQKGLGPEDYSRVFRTKAEAERNAAMWNRANTEAVAMWAEREAMRRAQTQEYLAARAKRGNRETQSSFNF